MSEYSQDIFDRRKRSDTILKTLTDLSTIGWSSLFASLLLIAATRPEVKSIFGFDVEQYMSRMWSMNLLLYSFCLQVIAFVFGCSGLIMNATRHRRRNDFFRGSLILLVILSVVGIAGYLYLVIYQ
jgi:hypothetical protein